MSKQNRGPLSRDMTREEEDKIALTPDLISYKEAFRKGVITAFSLLIIQFVATLIFYLSTNNPYFVNLFFNLINLEIAGFFILSGLSIWFEPSPSWNRIKATVMNKPYIPRTTSHAYRTGATRFVTGLIIMFSYALFLIIFEYIVTNN